MNSDQEKLSAAYSSLKSNLQQLEIENQRLAKDLSEKRQKRAERLREERAGLGHRARLKNLETRLKKTDEVARAQAQRLSRLRVFYRKNQEMLNDIAKRLINMEKNLQIPSTPVMDMKGELVNMLTELQEMREKRNKLLSTN